MNRWRLSLPWLSVLALACWLIAGPALAVPSFARQTGEECAACHIGGFGAQLTPHGRKFKLEAYADTSSSEFHLPLAAQAIGAFTHTGAGQPGGAAPHFSANDNLALQEASLFVAGRIAPDLGVFSQVTYASVDRSLAWDNLDLRAAHTFDLSGHDLTLGLSLNNSPTVSDPYNSLPAWQFPFTSSDLAPAHLGSPILADGLAQQSLGLTAYAYWNNWVYAEAGAYRGLPGGFLKSVGIRASDQASLQGPSPYWRIAGGHAFHHQYAELGVFGIEASQRIAGVQTPDKLHDTGIDVSYEYLGTRKHSFALNARCLREHRSLYGSLQAGTSSVADAGGGECNVNGTYSYRSTYGFTIGAFDTVGTADTLLYTATPISGSASGSPNTRGMIYQADYTPFGKENSWMAPWANLRLGLQYTAYSEFNGSGANYDGAGRNASDNNTLFAFLWLAL